MRSISGRSLVASIHAAREDAEHRRGDRRNRRQRPFRVPRLAARAQMWFVPRISAVAPRGERLLRLVEQEVPIVPVPGTGTSVITNQ